MEIIQLILTSWLLCVIALCFINLKWAVSLFMAYLMLVPYINLGLPGMGTGDNFIKLIMFMCLWKNIIKNKIKFNLFPFIPFIIYFIVSFVMIPFQDGVPAGIMFETWRKDVLGVLFLPFIIWNIVLINPSSVKLFRNTMIICVIIAIGYGLFLTKMDGFNPYAMYFLQFSESDIDYESYYGASGGGRLFGRISSVYIHPMTFALFIGFALIYLYYIRFFCNIIVVRGLLIATIIMAIICGVRSVIGGLIIVLAYYIVIKKDLVLLTIICFAVLLGGSLISLVPELSDYLGSIVDINNKNTNISGSSWELRFEQLNGAMVEASKSPLYGLGYKWTDYYLSVNGDHPICLAFESLIFVVICNSGIIGIFLWCYMVLKYFSINRKMKLEKLVAVNALIVFYISFSMITGEYGYMRIFLIFYILMLSELYANKLRSEKRSCLCRHC